MESYKFKVESFRKNQSPYDKKSKLASYTVVCDVRNLPLDIPADITNPRDQKLTHSVGKAITKGFLTDPNFWVMNRGILFSVDTVEFNNSSNVMTLNLTDLEKHGNVDGGHTYKAIQQSIKKLGEENMPDTQYVRLEILTGVEDFFEDLAGARNTSNQVDTKSLAELANQFSFIKDAIKDEPFSQQIAFKQYEEGKRIDAREIVALISMFNPEMYSEKSQPVQAYSSKEHCTKKYVSEVKDNPEGNSFVKMKPIIPDIFRLYSYIEKKMPDFYSGSKYGAIKGVIHGKEYITLFSNEAIKYESPKGFVYPILASLRALVEESEDGSFQWKTNPFTCFDDVGDDLVQTTIERSRSSGHNPQSVGKDSGHWAALFNKVQNYSLKKQLEKMVA